MKKLLVLAAVAAMAMGAKAEYSVTVVIPGAESVFSIEPPTGMIDPTHPGDPSKAAISAEWELYAKPLFFNAEMLEVVAERSFASWADRYEFLDSLIRGVSMSLQKPLLTHLPTTNGIYIQPKR